MFLRTVLIIATVFCTSDADWHKVWEDNFDGTALNLTKWKFETGVEPYHTIPSNWINNELQYYTNNTKNVRVENGSLVIEALIENKGPKNFTSGRLNSKLAFTRGKFEFRVSMPKGRHLWPAFWMAPVQDIYGEWPASGEIDIVEQRGQFSDMLESTIHYGGIKPVNGSKHSEQSTWDIKVTDLSKGFHNITFEWEVKEMRWALDGKHYFTAHLDKNLWSGPKHNNYTQPGAPFDKPFYITLNLAVGGAFFPEHDYGKQITPEEARHWSKPSMEFDYIRVYEWK